MNAGESLINIREIESSDLISLSKLFVEVFQSHPWNETWKETWAFERLDIIFRSYGFCGFLALETDSVVGAIFSRLASFKGEKELEVVEMYVSVIHQRKGVGAALIQKTEDYAKANDIKNIVLLTDKNTYAKSFYTKFSFSPYPENLFMCKSVNC